MILIVDVSSNHGVYDRTRSLEHASCQGGTKFKNINDRLQDIKITSLLTSSLG